MKKDKQNAYLKVSLLPLVILIGLIFGAGYFLLQGEVEFPKFNKGPTIQRMEGFPTVIYTDKEIQKVRKVITNEQELAEFLNLVDETGILTTKEQIDFEKNVVIAVATETNEETGHELKIKKVYEDREKKKILIEFEEVDPNGDCNMEIDKNIAVDMVMLSKTDWRIDFEKVTKAIECEEPENTDDGDKVNIEAINPTEKRD